MDQERVVDNSGYPGNLKKFLNWRKSEYFLIMYDAEKIQKNKHLLVSTHLGKKNSPSVIFFDNA
jgi:hypothetical protein